MSESTNPQLPGSTNSFPSQPLPTTSWNKLKICQWNADGICLKLIELCNHLINSGIGNLVVQESKLWKADKTPFIEGYATIWKDQNNILGGGLLLFIRTYIVFEKLHSFEKAGMEILSIPLKATKSTWLELYNIYLPNTSTQHIPSYQSHVMCCQTSGTYSCWPSLLHCWNQQHVQWIPSWFS